MKTKILLILICNLLICNFLIAQSNITYDAGSLVNVGSGADVCADTIIVHGTWSGSGTVCGLNSMRLKFSALIEGFYNQGLNKMIRDTVMVYIRVSTPAPYTIVDSQKVVLDSLGNVTINFVNTTAGSYYIVIKHRNSIETWSKSGGQSLAIGSLNIYDFTISQSQAYGNNLVLKGTRYCIYSGDVNQDGVVDGTDLSSIDNDASNFVSGYVVTDVNGDQVIDGSDLAIDDNNASGFVSVIKPPGALNIVVIPVSKTKKNDVVKPDVVKPQDIKPNKVKPNDIKQDDVKQNEINQKGK